MKFTINSKKLNETLVIVSRALASKNVLAVLDNFIFEVKENSLAVTASDSENWITSTVELEESSDNGQFAISAKGMLEATKNLPDVALTFTTEDDKNMKIQYGSGVFSLPISSTEDFPVAPDINGENRVSFGLTESLLQENIARAIGATASDDLRPIMTGIFFDMTDEKLNIVASDGHQLVLNSLTDFEHDEGNNGSFIMPKKPAGILKNILKKGENTVTISTDGQRVEVTTGLFTLNSRLIEGRYPNYNSVIPKNNSKVVTVDRVTLVAVLKRIAPFANDTSNLVKVHVENNTMQLQTEDYDFSKMATEQLPCSYADDAMTIGLKGSTLLGLLENIRSSEVTMLLADSSRAALIQPAEQPEGQEILMLQMPMLLND